MWYASCNTVRAMPAIADADDGQGAMIGMTRDNPLSDSRDSVGTAHTAVHDAELIGSSQNHVQSN